VHDEKGCPIPRRTRLSSTEDMKQWGVGLRADDGRMRGPRGGPAYSNYGGWTPRPTAELGDEDGGSGAEGGGSRAKGGAYCDDSTSLGSSGFSGTPRNGHTQLTGSVRGYSARGESRSLHNDVTGPGRGKIACEDAVTRNTESDGRWGEKDGPALEELVEQLSFNKGDHVDDQATQVGAVSTTNVVAGKAKEEIKGSGAHVGVVATEIQEVGVWVPQNREEVGTRMESSLSTMLGAKSVATQAEISLSTQLGATASDMSVRTWKRNARKGQDHAPVRPVNTNRKKRSYNPSGQAGGSTRGEK
jgi:hypothetical protein